MLVPAHISDLHLDGSRRATDVFAGRPLVFGPGVTWTLRLPWEGEGAADRDAPPGFAFHVLDDEGRLTSHFKVV